MSSGSRGEVVELRGLKNEKTFERVAIRLATLFPPKGSRSRNDPTIVTHSSRNVMTSALVMRDRSRKFA
jgi:hypothetical protein